MPTNAQVADALRAMAELIEFFDDTKESRTATNLVSWKSGGQTARIVAALDDHTVEEYASDHTSYLIHRGTLLGLPVEVMESQDD
jgi:hypothetical protein